MYAIRSYYAPFLQYGQDRAAVIDDKEPVAHILAVTVDRQFLPLEGVVDDQRNEFFREVVGAVVVGAVGNQGRQVIGVVVGADQMV